RANSLAIARSRSSAASLLQLGIRAARPSRSGTKTVAAAPKLEVGRIERPGEAPLLAAGVHPLDQFGRELRHRHPHAWRDARILPRVLTAQQRFPHTRLSWTSLCGR